MLHVPYGVSSSHDGHMVEYLGHQASLASGSHRPVHRTRHGTRIRAQPRQGPLWSRPVARVGHLIREAAPAGPRRARPRARRVHRAAACQSLMMTSELALRFAEWIAAWNAHDLPRILSHYADDFEMSSP